MEQFMPLEMLKNNFKANISKLQPIHKENNTTFYKAFTSFGHMTLIVQSFQCASLKGIVGRVQERNKLMSNQSIVTPLIFEQEIIKMRDDYVICMTLCESIVLCEGKEIVNLKAESLFQNLVKCAYSASNTNFAYESECYCLKRLVKSTHNSAFFFDFTKINLQLQKQPQDSFEVFKSALCGLMQECRKDKIQQINFICESPFLFNLQRISACENWFDLAMMFNLLLRQDITVITQARTKLLPINRLTGINKVEHNGRTYKGFTFRDGFRVDGTREITFEELKSRFFEDGMIYYMTKGKYMCVRKERIENDQEWVVNKIEYEDLILVRPQISKVQFINFLIGYIKFIDPTLHQLNFSAEENILQLIFTNRAGKIRKIAIKFHKKYVVKDEELSMIIQKSKLKKASLSLERMSFGDSFLIFLANCDKMLQVKSFNISHCNKVTDSGINLLISSPLCKNMEVLKINSLPLPDFRLTKMKMKLLELHINNCLSYEGEGLELGRMNMQRVEAIGVSIDLNLSEKVKYLYITQDTTVEQLKMLKDLTLSELRIKLVQSKKTISSFFNTINFYSKDNPLKVFCEGKSSKTLKHLDISESSVKLKDIKQMLYLQSLETLICQNMQRDKFIDIVLPHHIVSLSVQGSKVTAQILQEMTQRINFFIRLSIFKSDISERTMEQSIKGKKYINLLQIGEEQVDLKFLGKKTCVQGLQVHLHRLIRDENQPILNFILFKQITICKELNFVCEHKFESRLVSKVNRFLNLYQDKLRNIAHELTLNVNSVSILKLIRLKSKDEPLQSIAVVDKKAANHKIRINSRSLLAQLYGLPLVDQHLSIDLFNVTLHKAIQIYPNALLQICIRSNRLLDKRVILLIRKYAGSKLLAIDFRNCLFSYKQIQQQLYQFPYLQSVNEGEYEIRAGGNDECQKYLQRILKFFLKLRQDKIKLTINAVDIPQRELYFSIIGEIISHHASHIVLLHIHFQNIPLQEHSLFFWRQIFLLQQLQILSLIYKNDFATRVEEQMQMAIQFQKMANLNLFSLQLQTNIHLAIPQLLSFPNIHHLSMNYKDMDINEVTVFKLLRSTPTITRLALNLQGSTITTVHKISQSIQKMSSLAELSLNFENSTVKQHSLIELVQNLHRNTHLQRVDLNLNNCVIGIHQLVKACQNLVSRVKFCHLCIVALQGKKPNYFVDQGELLAMGIQLIFTA